MSELEPMPKDNIMPDVIGESLAAAEARILAHATGDVSFVVTGEGSTVETTDPPSGQQITDQVRIVVYNPPK